MTWKKCHGIITPPHLRSNSHLLNKRLLTIFFCILALRVFS